MGPGDSEPPKVTSLRPLSLKSRGCYPISCQARTSDGPERMPTTQANQSTAMALHLAFLFILLLTIPFQASVTFSQFLPVESVLSESTDQLPDHIHRSDFPKDFIFGSATSAYQVEGAGTEGGRGISIWDTWAHAGNTADKSNGDVAVDQYHRYKEDVELLAMLNMDWYRFSISWTRIFPDGFGPDVNKDGIAYYNRLIDALLSKGIKPYVTLFHWDLPQALEDSFGGWRSRQIVGHYVAFAEACFAAFGDRVKDWITLNEPGLFSRTGYCTGGNPPGRTSSADTEPYIVAHNLLLAHGAAVDMYRKKFQAEQKGVIGISIDCEFAAPLTDSAEDKDATQRRIEFQMGWFLDPIFNGDYPAIMRQNVGSRLPKFSPNEIDMLHNSLDFIGLNYYTTLWAANGPSRLHLATCPMDLDQHVVLSAERDHVKIGMPAGSESIYNVPWGLYDLLKWTAERYNAPIHITENGMDYPADLTLEASLRDPQRVQYYEEHLRAALHAVRDGIDVRAYFAWALLDNFQWRQGYTKRFGLIYVDYSDGLLSRHPKDSALWVKQFLDPWGRIHDLPA